MRDFALRLERTYVYRRPIHRLRRLHNRIALSEAAEANVLVRGLLSTPVIKLYLLNTKTAKHFVPSSFLAPSARLALSTGRLLAAFLSTFRRTCIVLTRHCLNVPIVEGTRGNVEFPRPPGYLVMRLFVRKGCFIL